SAQLASDQLDAFCQNWEKLDLGYARTKNLTPYDVLIIASMVEKETLSPDERQLVAAVIYNRLHSGMPLGIDATLRYGLNIPPTESIHESQLASDSPYNTRKRTGLPPTPIAIPGLAALGFVGANVTTPHKLAAARLVETDRRSVNTLVVREGRLVGCSTDAAVADELAPERPAVLGDGGAAAAWLEALPHATQ